MVPLTSGTTADLGTFAVATPISTGTDVVSGTNGDQPDANGYGGGNGEHHGLGDGNPPVVTGTDVVSGTDATQPNWAGDGRGGEQHHGDGGCRPECSGTTLVFGGTTGIPLPAGLSVLDISSLVITDTDTATDVLSADFSASVTTGTATVSGTVSTTPGIAAPMSKGMVAVSAIAHKGTQTGTLRLQASKLPGNVYVTLSVNGKDVGNYRTDRKGTLSIARSQAHTSAVKAVKGGSAACIGESLPTQERESPLRQRSDPAQSHFLNPLSHENRSFFPRGIRRE